MQDERIYCDSCGAKIERDEMCYSDTGRYCEECNDLASCNDCGKKVPSRELYALHDRHCCEECAEIHDKEMGERLKQGAQP